MATISAATDEKVYAINRWLGLNEHPDGDTKLKFGEASKMVNWRVTRDGNLKRRPGTELIYGLCNDYTREIAEGASLLYRFQNDDDIVQVYTMASADADDGRLHLTGHSGTVEHGTWDGAPGIVHGGMLAAVPQFIMSVQGGTLRITTDIDALEYTISDLAEHLHEIAGTEEPNVYVVYGEGVYAVNESCIEHDTEWRLSGRFVKAVPVNPSPVMGMWSGMAGNKTVLLAACDGTIWNLWDDDNGEFIRSAIARNIQMDKGVSFIPFDGKVYIQTGYEYYVYDGLSTEIVEGYSPLVAISIGPLINGVAEDAGDLTGEYVNLLCPKRRVRISPDGNTNKTFQLPEKGLKSIDAVIDLTTGNPVASGWSGNPTNGTVTFTMTLAKVVNAYEIQYTAKTHSDDASIPNYREQVTSMLYSEIYSGTTDTRLFFYGNGTNKALYTGMDYNGQPRADYFPDQYEVAVGDSNTPITAMVRHYSTLIAYKPTECWSLEHGIIELADNNLTPAVYCTPVNRDEGNLAPGQVRLVDNSPVTCSGTELYQWINSSYYSSNLSRDERQAKRISDRIQVSIRDLDFPTCRMWDDNDNQEFYIVNHGIALVWNYVQDAWYRYEGIDASRLCNFRGEMYIGTSDGAILRLTDERQTDNGALIEAHWESGAMDFGAAHMRKYSSMMWVGLKPEKGTSVDVCVLTDRKNTFRDKIVSSEKAKIAGEPFMVRTKIKAKKFAFYHLLLSVTEKMPPVTVTNVSFRVRQTGYAK